MPAHRRDASSLQPRRAATHDQHPPWPARRGDIGQFCLPADGGILHAFDGQPLVESPDATFVGADAQADVIQPSLGGFPGHLWIRDDGARHPDQVRRAIGQHALSLGRMDDPTRVQHGGMERFPEALDERQVDAMWSVG